MNKTELIAKAKLRLRKMSADTLDEDVEQLINVALADLKRMDLQTLIIAMSIPSGVTAFCFWMIEQKIKKQQTEAEEKEKIREKNEVLIIKSVMASIALGEAAATALKNGHANGETEAVLEYARKIKHEQKDFLTEQGIKGIYE